MRHLIKYLLLLYQKVSPYFVRRRCRFYPTCSDYTIEAIDRHGALYGCFLASLRLIRCNQLFPGGHDPVPASMFHVKHHL